MDMYTYFLQDICDLISIRELIASLEQTTRKEHYSLQQEINKLNLEAQSFSKFGATDIDAAMGLKQSPKNTNTISNVFKNIANKFQGKTSMTEKEVYLAIKAAEKKLRVVDQLQTY